MTENSAEKIQKAVQERYREIAREAGSGCCGESKKTPVKPLLMDDKEAFQMGYTIEELESVPEGANLNLGCGNPQAIAALQPGEVVLDLGSGAGFDSFLVARQVGDQGRVIGVDLTPEMVERARENAARGGYDQVEFHLGEIEDLPLPDNLVDVILSNCVINLSPDKHQVFKEAYRVLKPGGRLAISDVVATAEIPAEYREDLALYSACFSGALLVSELEAILAQAGFREIKIQPKDDSELFIREWSEEVPVEKFIKSASIEAVK